MWAGTDRRPGSGRTGADGALQGEYRAGIQSVDRVVELHGRVHRGATRAGDRRRGLDGDRGAEGGGHGSAPADWEQEPSFDASVKRGQLCSAIGTCDPLENNPYIYPDFRTGSGYGVTYDARAALEHLVRASESDLSSVVQTELGLVDLNLKTAADASEPIGNWSSSVWIWKSALARYTESAPWIF